jgi:hypothetical protein
MKKKCVGTPVTVGEITIIPMEEVNLYHDCNKDRLSIFTFKKPVGVVINSPQGKWAIDVYGQQVSMDTYIQEIHGLQQALDSYNS